MAQEGNGSISKSVRFVLVSRCISLKDRIRKNRLFSFVYMNAIPNRRECVRIRMEVLHLHQELAVVKEMRRATQGVDTPHARIFALLRKEAFAA